MHLLALANVSVIHEVLIMMSGFVFLIAAFFLIALFAFYFWRAGRRSAWRRWSSDSPLCPRCGYDLRAQSEARCSECGSSFSLGELWIAQRDQVHEPKP